jgi:hypothetical protein
MSVADTTEFHKNDLLISNEIQQAQPRRLVCSGVK